ncbi:MAG: type II toxin-antitoxin system VapC family toxin [Acidobacteria bacterium]|nr:type II toxin-antitoxin system VapC family toxin [Acidobacteriota bacterium]
MERVYLETSVVSYLVALRSRDLIVAGRQQLTIDWWEKEREKYELYVSEPVIEEAQVGDPAEIAKRTAIVAGVPILTTTLEAEQLARLLVQTGTLPPKAAVDALHIALATVHEMDYLLTWNMKHIANAHVRKMVARIFAAQGHQPPVICTPEELGEIV